MNFNLDNELTFSRAQKPNQIKTQTKNWTTIEGYVYIISKVMPPHENDKPLHCVKAPLTSNSGSQTSPCVGLRIE